MKELLPLLHGDALTVTGKRVAENVSEAKILNSNIIRNRMKSIVGVASSHDQKTGSTCYSRLEAAPTE